MLKAPYDLYVSTVRIKFPQGPGGGVLKGVTMLEGKCFWGGRLFGLFAGRLLFYTTCVSSGPMLWS